MNSQNEVACLLDGQTLLPLGTTKKVKEVSIDTESGIVNGGTLGIALGVGFTMINAMFNTGDIHSFVVAMDMLFPITAPLTLIGAGAGYSTSRYLEVKDGMRKLGPGTRIKDRLPVTRAWPSFREKREIISLSAPGVPDRNVVLVRKKTKVWVESLSHRPATEVWDETMTSLKKVYRITPKPRESLQKTEDALPSKKQKSTLVTFAIPDFSDTITKVKNKWNRTKV